MRFVDFVKKCVCVFTALAVGFMQPASAIAAGASASANATYFVWDDVRSKDKCVSVTDATQDATASNQASPTTGGDDGGGDREITNPNSNEHKWAQVIFDQLTKDWGISGNAACGILANIRNESHFQPDAAEGSSDIHPWQPEHAMNKDGTPPDDGLFAYSDSGGGAGLFQFTPYDKYNDVVIGNQWYKQASEGDYGIWAVENQIRYVLTAGDNSVHSDSRFQSYSSYKRSNIPDLMTFYTTASAADCNMAFLGCYERCADGPFATRSENAAEDVEDLLAVFNKDNVKADEAKIRGWLNQDFGGDGETGGAPSITTGGSSASDKKNTTSGRQCRAIQEGEVDGTIYIDLAKQYAEDASIGYSMGGRLKPDMDCSSFVYYCLVDSGAATEEELGGYPFSTSNEGAALTGIGFTEMDYSLGALQKGDVLWRDGHTEIYMGKYDENGNESEGGKQYSCGAHNDGGNPQTGDQNNKTHWWEGGQEVGGADYNTDSSYTKIYRPPAKMLQKKKKGTDNGMPNDAMNDAQKRIFDACQSVKSPGESLCATWTSRVYAAAGFPYPTGDACNQYWNWCHSNNKGDLKVGMAVATPSHPHTSAGSAVGHIGIYVGDGKVMDSIGYIRTMDLDEWISYYGATNEVRWGFLADGVA